MPGFSKPFLETHSSPKFKFKPVIQQSPIVFTAKIPFSVCRDWYNEAGSTTSCYKELLGRFLEENYNLSLDRIVDRLSENLRRQCQIVANEIIKVKGRARVTLLTKLYTLNITKGDLLSASAIRRENYEMKDECQNLRVQVNSMQNKVESTESEIVRLKTEIVELKLKQDGDKELLKNEQEKNKLLMENNEQLQKYVENLCGISVDSRKRKDFAQSGRSQQYNVLKEVKSRAECAVWFLKIFGLSLDSLTVTDSSGTQHGISYHKLCESEKEKLKQVLFILDRFYVSDACYHELSVLCNGLPKAYLIRQLRSDMNSMCHVQRTPGPVEGAEICVEEEVLFAAKAYLKTHLTNEKPTFCLKFCGDVTSLSRNVGMCLMSFSLFPDQSETGIDCHQHHAVAVVKAQESYDLYRTSFANVWKSINSIHNRGTIEVDGEEYPVKVCLGADHKFLLMVLGMSGATSNHACIYCKVHKNDRGDVSKSEDFYRDASFKHSIEDLHNCADKQMYGCKHKPLVDLPLEHIIVDELHLMLRITDRLLENLIQDVTDCDNKQKIGDVAKSLENEKSHLNGLVHAIRECHLKKPSSSVSPTKTIPPTPSVSGNLTRNLDIKEPEQVKTKSGRIVKFAVQPAFVY